MQENGSKRGKKKEWKFNREVGESSEETVKEVEEKRDRTKITAD